MNNTKLPTWKERTTIEKILVAIGFVISITVMILAILQLMRVTGNLNSLLCPLMGLFMLIQALQYVKYNKFIFFISLSAAVFIFIISMMIFLEG